MIITTMKAMIFLTAAMTVPLAGCVGNMNPTGGNSRPNYPYYVTQQPMLVKKFMFPQEPPWFIRNSTLKKANKTRLCQKIN